MIPSNSIQGWDERMFPDFENTTEKEKNTPGYCKKVCEAGYSLYVKNKTDIGAGLNTYYDTLRLFGKGKQPQERYKSFYSLGGTGLDSSSNIVMTGYDMGSYNNRDYNKKGWMNVNWDIVSPLPNVKTMLKGHFVNIDFDIKADAIDIDSGATEESLMYEYYAENIYGEIFNQLRSKSGLQQTISGKTSLQELEKIKSEGGFKTPYSIEHEKLLLHTENISAWDRMLKGKFLNDVEDLGRIFGYVYYDKETCKVKYRYLDPKQVIMQYSKFTDYRDADYGGFLDTMTISELKSLLPFIRGENGEKCTLKDIKDIALKYKGYSDNPSEIEADKFEQEIYQTTSFFDNFKICVMRFFWKDVIYDKKIEYTTKGGKTRYYPYDDTIEKLSDREKIKSVRSRITYQCTWFPGTKWVLDYGPMPNQPREPYYKPIIPIVGEKLEEESLTERLIPICDMFQIAWLKLQNAIAKSAEDGYAVNISQLANLGDKSGKFDPMKIIRFWKENGIIFYKTPPLGMQTGGTPVPITNVPGGLEQTFTKYLSIMDWCNRQIEVLIGMSPLSLGASPSPDQLVGTSQLSLSASNKALTVLIDAIRNIKEQLSSVASPMIQLAIKNDEKAEMSYREIIGEEGIQILKMARYIGVRYGINLVARPTTEEWNSLIELAKTSFSRRSPEVGGLNEGQYMWIVNQKNSGANFKEVSFKMQLWIKQDQERIQMEKEKLIQLQSKGNTDAIKTKSEADLKAENAKLKSMLEEIKAKMQAELILEGNRHKNELQSLRVKASLEPQKQV